MRALIIGPDEKAAIGKAVGFAMEPANWYHPGITDFVPGDNPDFVTHVPDGYRCVFTITKDKGTLYRHLSVSVSGKGKLPSPEACVALAVEFGFTVSSSELDMVKRIEKDGWMLAEPNPEMEAIVLAQPLNNKRYQN